MKGNRIVDVEPADGPSNHGRLCVKGRSASFDFVNAPDRLRTPLIKNHETGEFEPATWDEALSLVASKFMELKQQYGAGFAGRLRLQPFHERGHLHAAEDGAHGLRHEQRGQLRPRVPQPIRGRPGGNAGIRRHDEPHLRHHACTWICIMLVGSNPEEAHPVVGMQIRQAVERRHRS